MLHLSERKPASDDLLKVISYAKEYGFVFPSSEIYDGFPRFTTTANWVPN